MNTERDRTLKAVQTAIQMEIDGKEYYVKASSQSENALGRRLLESLAKEEDFHLQRFVQIYDQIRDKKSWPSTALGSDREKALRTVFSEEAEKLGTTGKPPTTEMDTVKQAMDIENKTQDFYTRQAEAATYDAEREFYREIAAQERMHHKVLLDYYEYLKDPASWFTEKEHPTLEG